MAEKRPRRKRSFLLTLGIAVMCAYLAISLISIGKDISDTKKETAAVKAETKIQQELNDELSKQLNNGDISEYAETVARDKYGYVKLGERVYFDVSVNS